MWRGGKCARGVTDLKPDVYLGQNVYDLFLVHDQFICVLQPGNISANPEEQRSQSRMDQSMYTATENVEPGMSSY